MITLTEIHNAYDRLATAQKAHHRALDNEINHTNDLELRRLVLIQDGTITGANPDMRAASARDHLGDRYNYLEECQMITRATKNDLEIARIRVEELRLEMRLLEFMTANKPPEIEYLDPGASVSDDTEADDAETT